MKPPLKERSTAPDSKPKTRAPDGVCPRGKVTFATWTDETDAHLVTSYAEVLSLAGAGELTLVRNPNADFRCPILPNG